MPFSDFIGNAEIVRRLREMLGRGHFPHAAILAGARGSGKYTLALMLARAMNCLEQPMMLATAMEGAATERATADSEIMSKLPDFCGHCSSCTRIALAGDLDARFAEAVEARDNLRETDKKDTRIFVQTHPDILVIPPDPPQMMIKVDQVRHVIHRIYYRPAEARESVYIFTSSAFMKEAANSLLKVLDDFSADRKSRRVAAYNSVARNDIHVGRAWRDRNGKPARQAAAQLEPAAARPSRATKRRSHGPRPFVRSGRLHRGPRACAGNAEVGPGSSRPH
jgi:DNA polymerase III delta prime subunit